MSLSALFNASLTRGVVMQLRNFSPVAAASDPIQKLFHEKAKEYFKKEKSSGGKLVDSSATLENELTESLARVRKQFTTSPTEDMSKFPEFKFADPTLEAVGTGMKYETQLKSVDFDTKKFGWPDDKPYYEDADS